MVPGSRTRLMALAVLILLPLPGSAQASQAASPDASSLKAITVSFKLDPRLMGGTYGGERWVSPPTYTSAAQGGKEASVEAKVRGVDARGRPVSISPEWTAADPEMVVVSPVSPGQLDHVQITAKHPGESKLKVAAQGVSKELLIKAKSIANGSAIQVEIAQGQ